MIADASFHRWRDAQGLMNPAEVVIHEVERKRVFVILKLFRESIRKARETTHRHSHCEVLPLRKARGNETGRLRNSKIKLTHYRRLD